jgi:hypothetical protein
MNKCMYKGSNIWLIKPNDFNRGRGVMLFNSLNELKAILKELTQGCGAEVNFGVNTVSSLI